MNSRSIKALSLIGFGILLMLVTWSGWGAEKFATAGSIFGYFWPTLFVIPLGLFFHFMFFFVTKRRAAGLLIPGGILIVSGVVCQIGMLFDAFGTVWPGFPLAVAFGLFEFYIMGNRNKWLLIPICILTCVSLLFFAVFSLSAFASSSLIGIILAALLIVGGSAMLCKKPEISDF